MCQGFLRILQLRVLVFDVRTEKQSLHGPAEDLSKSDAAVEHVNLAFCLVLQARLKEQLLVSLLNREAFYALSEQELRAQDMEMQVVDDAVGTHRVVAKAQRWLAAYFENLQQKLNEFVREDLGETVLSEKKEQRVVGAEWVLVE